MVLTSGPNSEVCRRQSRRTAILDAAEALFLEQGFGVSLSMIVQRSGGSLATIYQMFGNKQGLLRAVIDRECARDLHDARQLFESALSPREMLQRFGIQYHGFVTSPHAIAFARLVIAESLNDPEFGRAFDRDMKAQYLGFFTQLFDTWQAAAKARIDHPRRAAELYFSLMLGNDTMKGLLGSDPEATGADMMGERLAPFFTHFRIEG